MGRDAVSADPLRSSTALLVVVGSLAVPLWTCDADSAGDTPAVTTAGGGGVGGAEGGAAGSGATGDGQLVVDVVTTDPTAPGQDQPAQGAVVAFEMPPGSQIEQTVGADGRVTFEGVDWLAGDAGAVTAYLPGYVLQSTLGLTAETAARLAELDGTDELTLFLSPQAAELVTVSGIATHMTDGTNQLFVSATTRNVWGQSWGPGWSSKVEPGHDFTLLAVEISRPAVPSVSSRGWQWEMVKWAGLDHAAVGADETAVVLDLDDALAPTVVSGSFAIPDHGIGGFFNLASGRVTVSSLESSGTAFVGACSWLDAPPGGSQFDYVVDHVSPDRVAYPITRYFATSGDEASFLLIPGYPTDGAQPGILPEPVRFAETRPEVSWGEPVSWEMNAVDAADSTLAVLASIRNRYDDELVWQLTMPPATLAMTLPALPSTLDPAEVFGTGPLDAIVKHCEPLASPAGHRGWCRRQSQAVPVGLER